MMNDGLSAGDVMALKDGGTNMWNNPFVYLVWLWAFSAFGGNGFGFGGNANANGALTRAELNDGFAMNNIDRQLQGLGGKFNDLERAVTESRFDAQNCCCQTNRNIDAIRYENAKNTCDIVTANNMNTRDIIDSNNAGIQRVLDFMTADKIDALRNQLQSANATIQRDLQTAQLIEALRPFPTPSYITCSPYTPVPPTAAF